MTAKVRRAMRELVDAVIGQREDAAYTRKVLMVMIQTSVRDFERYHDVRLAANRIRDIEILLARNKAAKQKEQPT